jgi:hypothetical protein
MISIRSPRTVQQLQIALRILIISVKMGGLMLATARVDEGSRRSHVFHISVKTGGWIWKSGATYMQPLFLHIAQKHDRQYQTRLDMQEWMRGRGEGATYISKMSSVPKAFCLTSESSMPTCTARRRYKIISLR